MAKYWWIAVLPLTPLPLSYAMVVEGLPGLAVMGILGAFVATLWIRTDVVCFCIRGEPLHNTLVGVRTSKVQTGRGRGFPVIMREEAGKNGREKAQKRAEAEPHAKPR